MLICVSLLFLPLSQQRCCISVHRQELPVLSHVILQPSPPALSPSLQAGPVPSLTWLYGVRKWHHLKGMLQPWSGFLSHEPTFVTPPPIPTPWMQRLEPVCLPPTAAELRHPCTGPQESACQQSPWRRAEVTREATERHADVAEDMLQVDRDHFPFSTWKKKKLKSL